MFLKWKSLFYLTINLNIVLKVACSEKNYDQQQDALSGCDYNTVKTYRLRIVYKEINFQKFNFCHAENITELEIISSSLTNLETFAFKDFINLRYLTILENNWNVLKNNVFHGLKGLETLFINKIAGIEDGCFEDLDNLEILDFKNNNITVLPNDIFHPLKRLELLYISHNNLEILEDESLKGLESVKSIDLSYNKIRNLNVSIFNDLNNLEYIYLSYNVINYISGTLKLSSLKFLYLDHNELHSVSPIFESKSLSLIDLSNNKINEIDPNSFYSLKKLKTLNLSNNSIFTISLLFSNEEARPQNIMATAKVTFL